jgi:hypothetical protein
MKEMSLNMMYPIIKTAINTSIAAKVRPNMAAKIYAATITNVGAMR